MAGKTKTAPRTTMQSLLPRWMDQNDLTIGDASRRLKVTRKTLERWREGSSEPWDKDIPALAKKMGLPVEAFYPEPGPVETGVTDRLDVLEGQFNAGFEDLDTRLSAVELLLGVGSQGDGIGVQRAREKLLQALLATPEGDVLQALASHQQARAPKRRAKD